MAVLAGAQGTGETAFGWLGKTRPVTRWKSTRCSPRPRRVRPPTRCSRLRRVSCRSSEKRPRARAMWFSSMNPRPSGLAAPCHNRNPDVTEDDDKDENPETPSLEERTTKSGRLPGNRYVKLHRSEGFRRRGDRYIADEDLLEPESAAGRAYEAVRRFLFGKRLTMEAEETERLSVLTGLAILGSDNISSSAYATEEAMRVLALAGIGAFAFLTPISIARICVLAIVSLSQSQVIQAYPNGGGSYIVTSDNLGTLPGLVAASALLIDYVLTVATSTAAGVYAITSFVPDLQADAG